MRACHTGPNMMQPRVALTLGSLTSLGILNEAMVAMLAVLGCPSVRGDSSILGLLAEKAALVMPTAVDLEGSDVKDDKTRICRDAMAAAFCVARGQVERERVESVLLMGNGDWWQPGLMQCNASPSSYPSSHLVPRAPFIACLPWSRAIESCKPDSLCPGLTQPESRPSLASWGSRVLHWPITGGPD